MNFDAYNFPEFEAIAIIEFMPVCFWMMNMVILCVSKDDSGSSFEEVRIALIWIMA